MPDSIPQTMRALTLIKTEGEFKPGKVYHPTRVGSLRTPTPAEGEVLVKLTSAGFNHKDLFTRQSLYPGVVFHSDSQPSILGADGAGVVVSPSSHALAGKRVVVCPIVGWESDPIGPEGKIPFANLGAVKQTGGRGTFAEYIVVRAEEVVPAPSHLSEEEAGTLPLGGLTAWRAVVSKGQIKKGHNVLITGIGGGVALIALSFCVALGANVWVTSGSKDKIDRAVELGAQGGVSYKDATWPKDLAGMLPKERPTLDVVLDSGGGSLPNQVSRVLRAGGKVVNYGMTQGGDVQLGMAVVLQNQEFLGSTMGSRREFEEMVRFVEEHKVKVVIDSVCEGLGDAERGFELMKSGGQFGKIAILIGGGEGGKL